MKDKDESLPWDKKKIGLLLLFLLGILLILITAKSVFFGSPEDDSSAKNVRGARIQTPQSSLEGINTPGVSLDIEEKVEDIKADVESIDVSEIASSSPQIQKILNDIKSIKDYPSSTARQACENICKSL